MTDPFEDHCWKDVIPQDVLTIYRQYQRQSYVGPQPALLVIDLYELVYQGGPRPISEIVKFHPSSCGINAWNAIGPTQQVLSAARRARVPIFYTTSDAHEYGRPLGLQATYRSGVVPHAADFSIRKEFEPSDADVLIAKQRASAFFGTPLTAHLTELGIRSVIIVGETTSGCVRASAVDAFSHGYHVTIVEECCFDRSELSHKVNLFDLHHKYADVMKLAGVLEHLEGLIPAALNQGATR
jgi:nicotinamidase-related amidase